MDKNKEVFIVKAALGTMRRVNYRDRALLSERLKGAISSLLKINDRSMVISLMANFRSQLEVVSKEEFEFALNFNRDLIYGSLGLKK